MQHLSKKQPKLKPQIFKNLWLKMSSGMEDQKYKKLQLRSSLRLNP